MEASINSGVGQVIALHKSVFGMTNLPTITFNIRLFRRFEDFKVYHAASGKGFHIWSGGVYIADKKEIVTSWDSKPERVLKTIYHEASHAILHQTIGGTPLWFKEGSAEYFAKLMVARSRIGNEVWREGLFPCKTMLRENRLPSLETILKYTDSDWPDSKQHEIYATSWSVVQFLTSSPARKQVLQKYVGRLAEKHGNVDSVKLLGELYPGGLQKIEQDWRAWISTA